MTFLFLKRQVHLPKTSALKKSQRSSQTDRQTNRHKGTNRQTDRQVDTQSSFGWKLMGDDNPLRGPDKISPVRGANVKNNLRL